jgi:hypothetical protein
MDDHDIALGRFQGEVLARLNSIDDNLRRSVDDARTTHQRLSALEHMATQLKVLALIGGPVIGLITHRLLDWLQLWPKR